MSRWARAISIDFRSLRLFRFGLGLFVLADLGIRLTNFTAFHLDHGALPGRLVRHQWQSLFLLSSAPAWTGFLFALLAAAGVGLMFNWRPRTISIVAWVLAMSLKNRNTMIMYGGDDLFRLGLLWSALLPSGPRVDGEKAFSSWASACALGQIFALYFSAGMHKTVAEWFTFPVATFVALNSDTYAKPIARLIMGYPTLLKWSSISVFFIERLGWVLIYLPWRHTEARLLAFALFAGMHLGFSLFMHLELFPLIDIVLLALLLPEKFWDWLNVRDAEIPRAAPRGEPWLQGASVALISMLLFVNISSLPQVQGEIPKPIRKFMKTTGIFQGWSMFTPIVGLSDGYYRVISRTPAGVMIDEINQKVIDNFPLKPVDAQAEQGGFRWTRYLEDLNVQKDPELFQALLKYYCSRWRPPVADAETREISLYHFHETTMAPEIPVVATLYTLHTEICKP